MGLIIAKFRKKRSNIELLEKIDIEIISIENFQRNTEEQRKRIVGKFLVGSVGCYVFSAILFYFYYYPKNLTERSLYLVPFLLAPVFIFFMKRLLTMYYNRKLSKNRNKLTKLRTNKKQLLEKIMETETYKVARSILEQYAPEQVRKVTISHEAISTKPATPITPNPVLRNRLVANNRLTVVSGQQTPLQMVVSNNASRGEPSPLIPTGNIPPPSRLYMPPVNRTVFDKMVDYLIGEGPNNRYALICKQCRGHNGMTLMDEFEYTSYKCYYCATFNPARKRRPVAPKLQFETPSVIEHSDTSNSEKISGSSDSEESDTNELPLEDATESKTVVRDEPLASSDNEPNDFDHLSDLENRDSEADAAAAAPIEDETVTTTTEEPLNESPQQNVPTMNIQD